MVTEIETSPSPEAYKDRSVELKIFGILTIIGGSFFTVLAVCFLGAEILMKVDQISDSRPWGYSEASLYVFGVFGLLGVVLIWLGIGSLESKRWARVLLAVGAWTAVIIGTFGVPVFILAKLRVLVMSQMLASERGVSISYSAVLPPLVMQGMMAFFFCFICPLFWALFYSSRNTRLTCEARDPVVRWTDRCPLPVFFLSFLLLARAMGNSFGIWFPGMMPFFGMFLNGVPGILVSSLLSAAYAFLAWSAYRLKPYAWWFTVALLLFSGVSNFVTFIGHDLDEMVRDFRTLIALLGFVPMIGYVIWLRRYFVNSTPSAESF